LNHLHFPATVRAKPAAGTSEQRPPFGIRLFGIARLR
jgi:hypothetical protein